jgi:hypothetical protein
MNPLRFSVLKQMCKSPAHAKFAMEHEAPETSAMRFGRLAHAIFLGGQAGAATPVIYPGERRGKAWAEFKTEHDGADIVTSEEFDRVALMASELHKNTEARSLLMGSRERTVLFDYAGRACRATPDVWAMGHLTELKTTQDASPLRFPYIATRLAYHSQLAFYHDGLELAGLGTPKTLAIVAIETKPPHAVAVFHLTDRAIDYGRRLYRTWMEQFLTCEKSDQWPGYGLGVLDAPEDAVSLIGADGEELEAM